MSNTTIDLVTQLNDIRSALQEERRTLMARVALIDAALTGQPVPGPGKAKPTRAAEPKAGSVADAILGYVAIYPGATTKKIQDHLGFEHKAKTVEVTVHQLVSSGRLTKDDSSPRRFSLPEQKDNSAVNSGTPPTIQGKSSTSPGSNGAARPQNGSSARA